MTRNLTLAGARIILVNTTVSARAAQNIHPPVIVMLNQNDPVGIGLVASLPGGNTTCIASLNEDITPKTIEFQLEVVSQTTVIAALFNPANPTNPPFMAKLSAAAGTKRMLLKPAKEGRSP
jgi:ABC-type uncharacterized transport system substrate-binding protein